MLAHGWSILLVIHPCPTTEQGKESPPASSQLNFNTVRDIPRSIVIEGEVKGSEDLVIEGEVNGSIELTPHVLTVGPTGRVTAAQLSAKSVVVLGKVNARIQASELVRIGETGSVEGEIAASRLVVAVGAHLLGRVDV